jgi:hypothetical protein
MKHVESYRLREERPIEQLRRLAPPVPIAEVNWPDRFPAVPVARFRVGHDSNHLFVAFDAREEHFRAREQQDNGRVWEDSCVEFFIQPEAGGSYYNFECNATGTLLLGHGRDRHDREHAPREVLDSIAREVLATATRRDGKALYCWSLSLVIPFTALYRHRFSPRPGDAVRANFYKCGDKLPVPHFLSWNPVIADAPDFHLPACFGELSFQP